MSKDSYEAEVRLAAFEISPKESEIQTNCESAKIYCELLKINENTGWRLPTSNELTQIRALGTTHNWHYWSDIPNAFKPNFNAYVRAVRSINSIKLPNNNENTRWRLPISNELTRIRKSENDYEKRTYWDGTNRMSEDDVKWNGKWGQYFTNGTQYYFKFYHSNYVTDIRVMHLI